MKKRVCKIANFFAFNLLFFALYLNFIHRDKSAISVTTPTAPQNTAAFSGTMLVENPEQYLQKKDASSVQEQATVKN